MREDGAMVRRARRVAGAWVALGEYLHKTYHEVASWWHVLLTYQRVWTFAAVQLHVMVVMVRVRVRIRVGVRVRVRVRVRIGGYDYSSRVRVTRDGSHG